MQQIGNKVGDPQCRSICGTHARDFPLDWFDGSAPNRFANAMGRSVPGRPCRLEGLPAQTLGAAARSGVDHACDARIAAQKCQAQRQKPEVENVTISGHAAHASPIPSGAIERPAERRTTLLGSVLVGRWVERLRSRKTAKRVQIHANANPFVNL